MLERHSRKAFVGITERAETVQGNTKCKDSTFIFSDIHDHAVVIHYGVNVIDLKRCDSSV